jgi:anti-sigma regulatory factor (Ser/Thr protein kinase)
VSRSVYKTNFNFKGLLLILALLLVASSLWYTQQLVNILKEKSTEYMKFRIRVFEENINNPETNIDLNFFFSEVIEDADYPIIYTDINRTPQSWVNISRDIEVIETEADSLYLAKKLQQLATENNPIPIKYQDNILGYYYYGLSPVIYKLRIFPYLAIIGTFLFILFGYLGFSYIKRSEQQFIWVGMAKETAHQLGTPLSSLSGWLELLKSDDKMRQSAVTEMENDLRRLNKIANRFSKIGSVPSLKPVNLFHVIDNVVRYFQKRIPNIHKKITISTELDHEIKVKLNTDLFEWVLENLIKNAMDAIENQDGRITVRVDASADSGFVHIDVIDNGKGIATKERTDIFKPGFSTKKRGWGLGLSLARRIIEEYHGGRLILRESKPGQGSIFRIILKQ